MIISLVVALAKDNAIGANNKLLWHLPNDLKFFKNLTWGMPIIMGRKTFVSIAGKPLPGRINIVITRDKSSLPAQENLWVVSSVEEAIEKASETDCNEAFIIGGGEIYNQSISIADKIYLTRVDGNFMEATVFFPKLDEADFKLIDSVTMHKDEKHLFGYSFETWEKIIQS